MAPRLKLFLLVIILLFKGIIGQQYILKSDSPNLDGSEVCPRNIRLICVGIRVLVLYWNATTIDGSELVLASHSGGQEDYQIETHFKGISYNITPDFVFPYQDRSFFNVNATIIIELSSVVKQNIIGFSCGSTSHTVSSNLYSTNVTVIGQPPSPSITGCCHPSTSVSSDPITCSVLSNTEISFSWPPQYTSRYQIQRYRVEYDGRLVAPECLSSYFASPNLTCNFSGLNDRTEYAFSISAFNCGDQESPMTNLTISLAFLSEPARIQGVIITPSYNNNLQLIEIMVQWKYLESRCPGIDYDYMIFLKNSSGFIIQNSTVSCDGVEICNSLLKVLRDYDYDIYTVEISAYYYFYSRTYYNVSYTSNPINGVSTIKPNISVEFLPCNVKCYSNSSGTCEIHYIQNLLNDTISGTVNADNISVPKLQSGIVNYSATFYIGGSTFTLQDSSIIQYAYKWTGGILAWVIVGPILITLSIVFSVLINIVLLRRWKDFKYHLLLKAAIIFISTLSLLILLISLSVWIAGLVEIAKSGNCESVDQPQSILIAAIVVSAISFIMIPIVVIVYKYLYYQSEKTTQVQPTCRSKIQETLYLYGVSDEVARQSGKHGLSKGEEMISTAGHRKYGESAEQGNVRVKEAIHKAVNKIKKDEVARQSDKHGLSKAEETISTAGHKKLGESAKQGHQRVRESLHQAEETYDKINRDGSDTKKKENLPPSEYDGLNSGNASESQEYDALQHGVTAQQVPFGRLVPKDYYDHIEKVDTDSKNKGTTNANKIAPTARNSDGHPQQNTQGNKQYKPSKKDTNLIKL